MKVTFLNSTESTKEIKRRSDLVGIVSENVDLTRKGNKYWGTCPFHQEKTPSFCVDPDKQRFFCYGCNTFGDIFDYVMKHNNVNFKVAKDLLAARAGLAVHKTNWADMQRLQVDKRRREQEQALDRNIEDFLKVTRLDCFDIDQWLYLILKHIYQENDLERPVVIWALHNHALIEYLADIFATGTDVEQMQATLAFRRWRQSQDTLRL